MGSKNKKDTKIMKATPRHLVVLGFQEIINIAVQISSNVMHI